LHLLHPCLCCICCIPALHLLHPCLRTPRTPQNPEGFSGVAVVDIGALCLDIGVLCLDTLPEGSLPALYIGVYRAGHIGVAGILPEGYLNREPRCGRTWSYRRMLTYANV
jgi:hypothetical protein